MKKTLISLILPICLLFTTRTEAQTYTIGADNGINGAMVYPTPFGDYYKNMRTQHLYRASELTAAGMTAGFISEISWDVITLPASVDETEGYTIKLLSTGTSSLSLTTWESGATTVWGPTDYTPVAGINNFVLGVPFFWDGASNIIVEICGGNPAGVFTKNARVTWTGPLGFNGSHTYNSDVEFLCAYTGPLYYEDSPGGPDYRPQIKFTQVAATNCAVVPDAGTAISTATDVCIGESFTLSIDPIVAMGITYQWARSVDGLAYSNIAGATSSNFSTTQTSSYYYKCKVTCTLSGDVETSDAVFVLQNDPLDCYCIPTYLTGTIEGDYISHVELEDIDNVTGASVAPFYTYYSGISTEISELATYTIHISVGTYETNNNVAAWIDYNQDGAFGVGEKLGEVINLAAFGTGNITFTVPISALTGTTRLRIRDAWNTVGITACDEYGFGETEDYNVEILAAVAPTAAFSYTGDPVVSFTDLSAGSPTSWSWTFGDGGISALENPTHIYSINGTYNVCLTATNAVGSNTFCQNVIIDSYLPPVSAFAYAGDPTVVFDDNSTNSPTSWSWNFGDGGTSLLQNPVHTYLTNGVYNVCLVAANATGEDISCQNVTIDSYLSPVAAFTYSGDPTVTFDDNSTNSPTSWFWYFDDGSTSTLANPVHTYAENGTYNVCLTATNGVGSNTVCQNVIIDSYLSPLADFSYTGDPNVAFTDLSTNSPDTWAWDFGDGGTSTLENPSHTYALNGTFNVCLTATNIVGSNTHCENVIIDSYIYTPVTDFSNSGDPFVSFTDLSTNIPDTWSWNFDDGGTSTLQNPTHNYTDDGVYNVCLTASNAAGSDTYCKNVTISSFPSPIASFIFSGDPNVTFADLTTNDPYAWDWDFDDGGTSTVQNPVHFFDENGTYNVCLTATAAGGSDTYCANVIITTLGSAPVTDYTWTLTGLTLFFTDISTNEPSDWLWQFGDGSISGLQNPSHSYAVTGEYNVCLTAINDYGSMDNCKIINVNPVGILTTDAEVISLYPNPVTDHTIVVLPELINDLNEITLYNAVGTQINTDQLFLNKSNTTLQINTKLLPAGTYTIKIANGSKLYIAQFVKI